VNATPIRRAAAAADGIELRTAGLDDLVQRGVAYLA